MEKKCNVQLLTCFRKKVGSVLTFAVFLQVLFAPHSIAQTSPFNMVGNGNFEEGTMATGWKIGFEVSTDYSQATPPFPGVTAQGDYGIVTNAKTLDNSFLNVGDHTSGSGQMLVVNGTYKNWNPSFWMAGSFIKGICGLTPGSKYTFSYWVRSVSSEVVDDATRAFLDIKVKNGINLTLISGNKKAPLPVDGWQQVRYEFEATSSCIYIDLFNTNLSAVGNDFAIDDVELLQPPLPLSIYYQVGNPTCIGANNGFIVVDGFGGVPPYQFGLNGSAATNTTGYFLSLGASTNNSVYIKDAAGTTIISPAVINIVDPPDPLTVTAIPPTVCKGLPVTLTAAGTGGTYLWTALPADPSLTNANQAVATAKPVVNTAYTVTSSELKASENLVFNSDFSLGYVGFESDYKALVPNISGVQGTYGIVANAKTDFFSDFSPCGDHTTGTGKMMVIDGSIRKTDRVWMQTISVKPGIDYVFSYWVQSLAWDPYALLETSINGVKLAVTATSSPNPFTAPLNSSCGNWTKVTYTWNSGASTQAFISIRNENDAAVGNDFALDDISFTASISCNFSKSVSVVVIDVATPKAAVTVQPNCTVTTGTIVVSSPLGSDFEYSVGAAYQASPTFSGLAPNTYKVTTRSKTSGCISSDTSLVVNAIPAAPGAPTAAATFQPNCLVPTGTIEVTGPLGADFEHSVGAGYQTTTTFSGLVPKTYNVTTRSISSGCISPATAVVIKAVTPPPVAPTATVTIQPSCTVPTGTIVIAAPLSADFEYSIGGAYQPGLTFANLSPNTYNVTVRSITTGCISAVTALVVNPVTAAPPAPVASVTVQPNCLINTGTIVVNAPLGVDYEYSVGGAFQTGTTFSGLVSNTYTVSVRSKTTGCASAATVTVNPIVAAPGAPVATVTVQPTCKVPTGTIVVTAPLGPDFEYSNGGAYQSGTTFSGLVPNSYNITVRSKSSGCFSTDIILVVNPIVAPPAAPAAAVTIQPTCAISTGTIVISSPLGADLEYSAGGAYQASPTFTGLPPNTYNLTARSISTGCISALSPMVVNPVAAAPPVPVVSVTVPPTCLVATGTIVITSPLAADFEYSVGGAYQTGTTFSGLAANTYTVSVRSKTTGCSSSSVATVNPVGTPPPAPTVLVTVQPTCITPTGTLTVTAPLGVDLEYSIGGAFQASTTFAGLAPKSYNVQVRSLTTGCTSTITAALVNAVPAAPAAPTASATVQPSCLIPTGTIVITAPVGADIEYSAGGAFQTATTFTGLAPNTYKLTARSISSGCVSAATSVSINLVAAAPPAPTASVTVQPSCTIATGTIVVSNPLGANYEYSIGAAYQDGATFAGLAPGAYALVVRNKTTGCISPSLNLIVNPPPNPPTKPTVTSPVLYCQNATPAALVATGTNLKWFTTATGGSPSANAPVPSTNLPGSTSYYVSQTVGNCESERAVITVTINTNPYAEAGPESVSIYAGQSVTLNAVATGGTIYQWTPRSNIDNPNILNPTVSPAVSTVYTLTVTSAAGCKHSDKITVRVISDIIVPNVFSPNGDGINDKWMIKHIEDYPEAVVEIFNRYGQLLYTSTNASGPWDGTFKGQPVPVSAYVYIINLDKKAKPLKGIVSVVR